MCVLPFSAPLRSFPTIGILLLCLVLLGGCTLSPQPITEDSIRQRVLADQAAMYGNQEPISGPISLEEAMARALKYNLDLRMKMMESAFAAGVKDVTRFDMLPNLVASAGYSKRSNDSGGTSINIETGEVSLAPSTSQEREQSLAKAEFSWNLLDFGVSFYRAKQQADQFLISEENRRRVMQTILQDVRAAYWRAMGAQRLSKEAEELDKRVRAALARSRIAEAQGLVPPREALTYQRLLLDAAAMITAHRQELDLSKRELAALMNAPTGSDFTLVEMEEAPLPTVRQDIAALEDLALANRAELREEDYKSRISANDARRQLLSLFPGINLSAGVNYDSNKYLYNDNWFNAGVQTSWNLVRLLALPDMRKTQAIQADLDQSRRLALSMAVLTQVRVAVGRYQLALEDLAVAGESNAVDQRLVSYAQAAISSRTDTEQELIRTEIRALNSAYQRVAAYAAAQASAARIYNSIGLDVLPDDEGRNLPVSEFGQTLSRYLAQTEQSLFSSESVSVQSLPPLRVAVDIPKGQGLDGIDKNQIRSAVEKILLRNQIKVLDAEQNGPQLTMTLFLKKQGESIRQAQWRLAIAREDGSKVEEGFYSSTFPAMLDTRMVAAFAEAAVVANLPMLEALHAPQK